MVKEGEEPPAEAVSVPLVTESHANVLAKAQHTVCICVPVHAHVCKGVPPGPGSRGDHC